MSEKRRPSKQKKHSICVIWLAVDSDSKKPHSKKPCTSKSEETEEKPTFKMLNRNCKTQS